MGGCVGAISDVLCYSDNESGVHSRQRNMFSSSQVSPVLLYSLHAEFPTR